MDNKCEYRDDKSCYFHPIQVVIGVCHLCLNERLVVLASKQSHHLRRAKSIRFFTSHSVQKPPATATGLPKIFGIGSLLNRLQFRHRKSDHLTLSDASSSLEDSFISIKFENNNGVGSWEKNANTEEHCNFNKGPTQTSTVTMRWRKRIGHLFQRSNKASVCHADGVKLRNSGWITSLTKTRTRE